MNKTTNRKRIINTDKFIYDNTLFIISDKKYNFYTEILNKTLEQLTTALKIHKRLLVVRFDFHTGTHTNNNFIISKFLTRIRNYLQRKYNTSNIGYIWVREQEKSKKQHYHLAIFISGKVINYPNNLINNIKEKWQPNHSPTIKNPYYFIDQNNKQTELSKAIFRLSYLAKTRGKGYRDTQAKDYGASRLKNQI
jgi:hypothetical protein